MQVTFKGTKKRGDSSDYLQVGKTKLRAGQPTEVTDEKLLEQLQDEGSPLRKSYNFDFGDEGSQSSSGTESQPTPEPALEEVEDDDNLTGPRG